jgi:ATP-dependent RNA helicase RhlB
MESPHEILDFTKKKTRTVITLTEETDHKIEDFKDLDLSEKLHEVLLQHGWTKPTPVQSMSLPLTLKGENVAGFAQTGTGKTGVFLITITNLLSKRSESSEGKEKPQDCQRTKAVVIVPTRELAMQIYEDAKPFLDALNISSIAVFGGVDYAKQAGHLKEGVDVIIATPGRLKDYIGQKLVDLSEIEMFVCDEADRMFDMGFIDDVEFFFEKIPEDCQKLLFSATHNPDVLELAYEYLDKPHYISPTPEEITPDKIEHYAVHCNSEVKLKVLLGLLRDHKPQCAVIFTNTKLTAEWLQYKLEGNGHEVDVITGDLPQRKRIKLIKKIKKGELEVLIATDVASRGLHIARLTHVYNFDLPDDPSNYVHRVGRTARAGKSGLAYSLVCDDYGQNLTEINELLGENLSVKSEWYPEEYLTIDDKAGNPYKVAKKPQASSRRPQEFSRRPQDTNGRDRGKNPRNQRPDRNSQRRGGERGKQGSHGRGHPRDANKPGPKKGAPPQRQPAGKPSAGAQKTGSIVKKIIKTLFGFGKK